MRIPRFLNLRALQGASPLPPGIAQLGNPIDEGMRIADARQTAGWMGGGLLDVPGGQVRYERPRISALPVAPANYEELATRLGLQQEPSNLDVYLDSPYAPDTDIDLPTSLDVHNMPNWGVDKRGDIVNRDLGTVLDAVDEWSAKQGQRPMRVDLTPGGVHISDMGPTPREPFMIPEEFGQGGQTLDQMIFRERLNRYLAGRPDVINALTDTSYDAMTAREGRFARRLSPKPSRIGDWGQERIYDTGDFSQSGPYQRFFQKMKDTAVTQLREEPNVPVTQNQTFLDILGEVLRTVDPRRKAQILQRFGLGALLTAGVGGYGQEEEDVL